MRNLFIVLIFIIINCMPKPFVVPQEGKTVKVYFKKIGGNYGQLVEKTQFHVFRNSNGWVVPVEDSLKAEYYIKFIINSYIPNLKNPEDKMYDVIVKVKLRENSSLVGMAEAKDKGNWNEIVTPLSKGLADNLVPIFERILKEKNKEETPEPEKETENEEISLVHTYRCTKSNFIFFTVF
jgi:hypothetical protein